MRDTKNEISIVLLGHVLEVNTGLIFGTSLLCIDILAQKIILCSSGCLQDKL